MGYGAAGAEPCLKEFERSAPADAGERISYVGVTSSSNREAFLEDPYDLEDGGEGARGGSGARSSLDLDRVLPGDLDLERPDRSSGAFSDMTLLRS